MMAESLLYRLHSGGQQPGVSVDHNRFRNVYNSKYNKVRIWQVLAVSEKSRKWCADPSNRVCDAPGSWYCVGKYPPLLRKLFKKKGIKKKSFKQLEDFNKKSTKKSREYQEKYHKKMAGQGRGAADGPAPAPFSSTGKKAKKKANAKKGWKDTDESKKLKELILAGKLKAVKALLADNPAAAKIRSADGRGPLFWAYQSGKKKMIKLFKKHGADKKAKDADGNKPKDLTNKDKDEL
jgi:dolichyl-diphosphooligosaccharide--protein glycosyltransferase